MKHIITIALFAIALSVAANDSDQEWESLDLEETHVREMEEEHRRLYEDKEGDLQIQAEEEEIIPLESEDSRYLNQSENSKEED